MSKHSRECARASAILNNTLSKPGRELRCIYVDVAEGGCFAAKESLGETDLIGKAKEVTKFNEIA